MVDAVTNVCLNQELQNVHVLLVSPLEVTERLALMLMNVEQDPINATPMLSAQTLLVVILANVKLDLKEMDTHAGILMNVKCLVRVVTMQSVPTQLVDMLANVNQDFKQMDIPAETSTNVHVQREDAVITVSTQLVVSIALVQVVTL